MRSFHDASPTCMPPVRPRPGLVVKDAGDAYPFRVRFDEEYGGGERDNIAAHRVARLAVETIVEACGRLVRRHTRTHVCTIVSAAG